MTITQKSIQHMHIRNDMLIHNDEIISYLEKMEEDLKGLWQCPKTDKCVMDCHHKIPHEYEKWCNQRDPVNKGSKCPSCVKEIAADITFFPEDFEIV